VNLDVDGRFCGQVCREVWSARRVERRMS